MTIAIQPIPDAPRAASADVTGTAIPASFSQVTDVELPVVNQVVADSIGSWGIARRVLRLALPSLCYDAADLQHMSLVLAHRGGSGLAVAAWEEHLGGRSGARDVLLHGLYVTPPVSAAVTVPTSSKSQANGPVRADLTACWRRPGVNSEAFFLARGFRPVIQSPSKGLYPIHMWKALQ